MIQRLLDRPRSLTVAALASTALAVVAGPAAAVELLEPPASLAPFEAPQTRPSAAALADGGFVVVFEEGTRDAGLPVSPPARIAGRDGDAEGIVAQRLDPRGQPIGEAIVVNTSTAGSQLCPRVAANPTTGGFLVAWLGQDFTVEPPAYLALYARRFDATGAAVGGEILISAANHVDCSLDVALEADGTATLVARSFGSDTPTLDSYRLYPSGDVELVDTIDVVELVDTPRARLVPVPFDGALMVTGEGDSITAVRLDADGRFVGSEVPVGSGRSIDAVYRETPLPSPPIREVVIGAVESTTAGPSVGLRFIDPFDPAERPARPVASGAWSALATIDSEFLIVAGDEGSEPGDSADPRPTGELTIRRVGADGTTEGPVVRLDTGFETRFDAPLDVATNADGLAMVVWERSGLDDLGLLGNLGLAVVDGSQQTIATLGADGRFEARITWRDFEGVGGVGFAKSLADDTAAFWFFDPANLEVTVKVLDGRAINGHFWVFNGSLTNVEYTLTVTDTDTGRVYSFTNPLGQFGSFGDIEALPEL